MHALNSKDHHNRTQISRFHFQRELDRPIAVLSPIIVAPTSPNMPHQFDFDQCHNKHQIACAYGNFDSSEVKLGPDKLEKISNWSSRAYMRRRRLLHEVEKVGSGLNGLRCLIGHRNFGCVLASPAPTGRRCCHGWAAPPQPAALPLSLSLYSAVDCQSSWQNGQHRPNMQIDRIKPIIAYMLGQRPIQAYLFKVEDSLTELCPS